ncbi:LacI family transcriptional regulator [Arthrobacter sp. StoSoilA2]|uniref:LacI family DNA-binding transcriptional regulator n=1 Tax=unclassified Arthrobacter TaxID=235627 RepID=UPI001CC4A693|nr:MULTISPECIES: LacI family DNA-binding transcriptional regulator [unclassified Arthrobacter]BCW36125.1 LacI family transcriptional regulator [Arthrobacter sp. StoSoilA2]BCW48206.1 LacI family transcriptional regulator [Arthrobacter sp. StoSoilB13]
MVTTKDIAAHLQLSVSTVGRALADDARISDQTKARVRQAASELGYVGNHAARMMRGAPSNVVGLVIPDIRNSFYFTIAHELSTIMAGEDYQLMLAETFDDRLIERRHLRELSASRAAGVVIAPTPNPHSDSINMLSGMPHVQLLRKHSSLGAQWFGINDRRALKDATTHLLDLGHSRIAYIGAPADLPTGRERLEGYSQALHESNVPQRSQLVELGPPASPEHAREAIRRLLNRPSPPTAVVLGSVLHTVGVLDGLLEMGIDVPTELSVVGFGDQSGFSWWGPGLTTVSLPIGDVATSCGLWFIRRLNNPPAGNDPYESASVGWLVQRGSTAPPPAASRERSA